MAKVDHERQRYPHSIVWTPIPCLTWLFPFIGHMGIATTEGIIRDFAGPYYVSQDNMAFGAPTKYWTLDPSRANGEPNTEHSREYCNFLDAMVSLSSMGSISLLTVTVTVVWLLISRTCNYIEY